MGSIVLTYLLFEFELIFSLFIVPSFPGPMITLFRSITFQGFSAEGETALHQCANMCHVKFTASIFTIL
jgi:hypothetical protein